MAQDTTPAIVCYQGTGSNNTFSVPFDKGYYGEVKVLFVRRGLADYTYYPDTYTVSGRLYAWINGTTKVYTHTPNPSVGAKTYNSQDVEQADTVSAIAGQTITVDDVVYSRSQTNDISNNLILTWEGDMLEVGDFICIIRDTERGQPYVLPNNQKHIERALDNLERQIQEVKDATDVSLKVDPSYDIEDSHKMDPVAWLETILRSVDKSVRALRYANGWLDYSFDDPNIADADKKWTHLLSAENVKNIRERSVIVDGETLYYAEYLSSDGTWRMFADTIATVNTKVDKAGDTMTGTLVHAYGSHSKYLSANNTNKYMDVFMNDDIFTLYYHYTNSSTATLSMRSYVDGHFNIYPNSDKGGTIGFPSRRFEKIYTTHLCGSTNGNNYLIVPDVGHSDTIATKSQVDLAANSGSQLYTTGVWYAKMYAATVVPTGAEYDGRNYADFSQVDSDNNPVIKIYTGASGAWTLTETITPPADYNGYMTITSKIWDIADQSGQQGGQVLWDYTHKTFTPYPRIVSFESINITGNSTVVMPATPTDNSIPNKKYVDDLVTNSGTGRNVGDIFFTSRTDSGLNGAVECNGGTYDTTDFTGAQSIGDLLTDGKVPYVSLAQYATLLSTQGSVGVFGWDGGSTTTFRVPSLNDIFIETGTAAQIGDYLPAGLPNITAKVQFTGDTNAVAGGGAAYATADVRGHDQGSSTGVSSPSSVLIDASKQNAIYGNSNTVQPNTVRYRAMIQLAISATDEAVMTCTNITAQVAANTSAINGADYVVETQLPTAQNNYTWYRKYKSGWVEQGGVYVKSAFSLSSGATTTISGITLSIELAEIVKIVQLSSDMTFFNLHVKNRTTTGFDIQIASQLPVSYSQADCNIFWEVKGMAQG